MHAGQDLAATIHPLFADRVAPQAARPVVILRQSQRTGDTYAFDAARAAVEIVVGFRPGIDQLRIARCSCDARADRLMTTEEDGSAVILDRRMRRIVLQGVTLADLVPGDIEIG